MLIVSQLLRTRDFSKKQAKTRKPRDEGEGEEEGGDGDEDEDEEEEEDEEEDEDEETTFHNHLIHVARTCTVR